MKSAEFSDPEETPGKKRGVSVYLQIVLSILILGCGVALAAYYLKTGPEAKPKKRQASPPLVKVTGIHFGRHQLTVTGMGAVLAAKEINLTPGVGGEIIAMSDNMVPGGFFKENETLVRIDPVDYQLTIKRLQSEIAKAQNDIELEMGNQRIARKEFEILGEAVTPTEKKLMLRDPQLGIKKATLQGIRATLAQAELDLKRTRVHAPFNGVVLSRSVNLGSRISQSTVLARLAGTDQFWLKLAVPADQLAWINFPADDRKGSEVRIFLQEKKRGGPFRTGRVLRPTADVEEQGRMATVYVAIEDPLCLQPGNQQKPRLLLGSFVQAEIAGVELPSVVAIDRNHLREDDTIWLLRGDNTLEIRKVRIVARTLDQVFVASGLTEDEQLIVSALSSPMPGTPLQRMPDDNEQPTEAGKGAISQ
ncbi:efflux RND transporter periplasmic adaptor subunit [Desulfopila sp. IMCC35006]|uniref:efflux RND transporter periplasmic adaptor subunit n=1 Tax=Desulfopila sp. IMCC35006 TaxID=2569542 RepID=UPI0010AD1229|nr:efflux RND transporter periplasmic adaptor subunit [Desulfopila sp. IMCC35006]TKB24798.1 efflux RND transporter periplasmic adaptor subunit [Desulfopila sp. IMCC35006]